MDDSWDSSGASKSKTKWNYGKHLFTGFVVAACVLGAGTIGVVWYSLHRTEIHEAQRERAKPDWASAATVVAAMRSEDGSMALYRANPSLGARFRTEKAFLEFAARWRPFLEPLPVDVPDSAEKNFGHRHGFGVGPTILSYRMSRGCWITLQWSGPHTVPSRKLTDIECSQ